MAPSSADPLDLPTYADVVDASDVLRGVANVTPLATSRTLDAQLGNGVRAYVKCENYQRMGAFKFRGAYNALSRIPKDQSDAGVLTFSSGNHAQAVALSAKLLGLSSTIIMPSDAPRLKIDATKGYGGDVVFYDRYSESRDDKAAEVSANLTLQRGSKPHFVPPYDHKLVIAGQGTVGKELFDELSSTSCEKDGGAAVTLDYLFVCVGGGGLISGCALAAEALAPNCKVIGVEPEAGNDAQRSLASGEIVHIETPQTIADGAQTQHIGKLTFQIMKEKVTKIITVSDEDLVEDMKFFGERMKMIVEPTGCLGLAGLRKMVQSGEIPKGSRCGVIVSGGNVDLGRYSQLILSSKKS